MGKAGKIILAAVLVLVLACGAFAWYLIAGVQDGAVPTVEKPDALPETTDAPEETPEVISLGDAEAATPEPTQMPIYAEETENEQIVNILLVGTDSRTADETAAEGLSDSMMLVSYNRETGAITLVSFMRDACVKRIGERSYFYNKLNGAYKNGGVGELVNTLNLNFGLDIQNYVTVGYDGFSMLVDEIGGVDMPITGEEAYYINWRYCGLPQDAPKDKRLEYLVQFGLPALEEDYEGTKVQHLDGGQALWYSRDRTTASAGGQKGSDGVRISRQQAMVQAIFDKVKSEMSLTKINALIGFAVNHVSTNLSVSDMSALASAVFGADVSFVSARVPFEDAFHYGVTENGEDASMLYFDIDKAAVRLHTLLYGA